MIQYVLVIYKYLFKLIMPENSALYIYNYFIHNKKINKNKILKTLIRFHLEGNSIHVKNQYRTNLWRHNFAIYVRYIRYKTPV